MLLSYLVAMNQHRNNQQRAEASLTSGIAYLEQTLFRRMSSYAEILRSGASLARISGAMDRKQWHDFIQDLDVQNRYPGTRAFAYAAYVPEAQLSKHEQEIRSSGDEDYNVTPIGSRELYVPVTFAELAEPSESDQTFGFDLYTDPERRAALIAARDSGEIVATDPIVLQGDLDKADKPAAVTIYYPVFSGENKPENEAERRARIRGFTFAALRVSDLIVGLFGQEALNNPAAGLQLQAITADNERKEIYSSPSFNRLKTQEGVHIRTVPLTVHSKTWEATVVIASSASSSFAQNPWVLFFGGFVISILVAALLFMLMINRLIRTMASEEIKVQQAKEELLSLASHQLRTPASGVKQYLGMVLQGYSGRISKQQKEILDKAYSANERQLEIIDQLLYVAQADAGQIRLEKKSHNFTKLVEEVVAGYEDEAASKKINLSFRRAKPLEIKADPRFVRMIVENLISNAIKYSYPGGSVNVVLEKQGNRIFLRVKDKGVGIAKVQHDRLFQKFSRIDNELSREAGGSGLGLFLAQELAVAHGGSIKVSSEAGAGAVFALQLPVFTKKPIYNKGKRRGV